MGNHQPKAPNHKWPVVEMVLMPFPNQWTDPNSNGHGLFSWKSRSQGSNRGSTVHEMRLIYVACRLGTWNKTLVVITIKVLLVHWLSWIWIAHGECRLTGLDKEYNLWPAMTSIHSQRDTTKDQHQHLSTIPVAVVSWCRHTPKFWAPNWVRWPWNMLNSGPCLHVFSCP